MLGRDDEAENYFIQATDLNRRCGMKFRGGAHATPLATTCESPTNSFGTCTGPPADVGVVHAKAAPLRFNT